VTAPRLAALLTSFVGRQHILAELRQHIEARRLVTLTGPPGIGKTRLALRAATSASSSFGSVYIVELAALQDARLVPRAVAHTLNILEQPEEPLTTTLVNCLADRKLLLVLDNCEHVLTACGELLAALLIGCPQVHALATSRQPLATVGETVYRVPPLDLARVHAQAPSEAEHLFVDRAAAVVPGFELVPSNAAIVEEVCRQLDGIPLAIELAAARMRILSLEQLVERLRDRFRLLRGQDRLVLPRQQTLLATLDWSYDLLDAREQILFNRLSVFAGGFALDAAEAVCCGGEIGPEDVLDLLTSLLDKSLVVRQSTDSSRLYLLETLREYARLKLEASGESARVRDDHRLWCLTLADRGARDIWTSHQAACIRGLDREVENIRTALSWSLTGECDPEPGLRIASSLLRFWDVQGYLREGQVWLSDLLALPSVRDKRTPGSALAMTALGWLAATRGEQSLALSVLDESLAYWRAAGSAPALATALFTRGYAIAWLASDAAAWSEAEPWFRECLAMSREGGPRWAPYLSLYCLAESARLNGERERAQALITESIALAREAGDIWSASLALISLGWQVLLLGDGRHATRCALESLEQMAQFGDLRSSTYALELLGAVASVAGQAERAAHLFGAAEALREGIGQLMPASVRPECAKCVDSVRERLGPSASAAAWDAGRAMPLEEAVAYARAVERSAGRAHPARSRLTRRELEVLQLVAQGLTNREIARSLVVSHRTVKRHLDNIFAKLDVSSRTAAAAVGLRSGSI
jgi:predicted ATPase/DNA-binding CsgD family transcriptional regulator